ncbi:MAG: DUF429 domain-containing protein [Rhizobiaceae bacterium]|nr:DUF429 domain-containing protein [Rhizobiaceae bacterium]
MTAPVAIVGVDGCKAGWIAVGKRPGSEPAVAIHGSFDAILAEWPDDAILTVDMPIGLPARSRHGGRGPEGIVRRFLGHRQSSVFSIPSRAAVYAAHRSFTTLDAWYEDHRCACAVARATSEPPRGVSIQAFALFPKIREIDTLLVARPELRDRVFESHPELAFWVLNGRRPMSLPKKVKSSPYPPGMDERRALLADHGFGRDLVAGRPPSGAGEDDLLDAMAMLFVAARHARGEACFYPDPPDRDAHGIAIAISA